MRRIFTLLVGCIFFTTLSAQNFIKFDAVDGSGVKALNGLAHRTGAAQLDILVPANFDVSNVTVDYAIAETDEIITTPFPTDFTNPQTISVKGASTTKNWTVTFRKIKPAPLPFSLTFSNDFRTSEWTSETEGWAGAALDPNSNTNVIRFGNVTTTFITAFNSTPNEITYKIYGVVNTNVWAGEFDVYTSADGVSWNSLKKYSEADPMPIGSTAPETTLTLPSSARYVKWVYTNRSGVNVTLNNISITEGATVIVDHDSTKDKIYVNNNEIIFSDASSVSKLEIYNTIGSLVQTINNPDNNINLSSFAKGVYVAKATSATGKSVVLKFIVK